MWNTSGASLPSVLIVQNKSGNVFIVENNSKQSQVEKILKKDLNIENLPGTTRRKLEVKVKSRKPSPIPINEIKQEPEDDDYFDDKSFVLSQVPFIDPSVPFEDVVCKREPSIEIEVFEREVKLNNVKLKTTAKSELPLIAPQSTFDGNWSSDDGGCGDSFRNYDSSDSDDEPLSSLKDKKPKKQNKIQPKTELGGDVKQLSRDAFWSHKSKSLAGKIACKYCDTIFETKDEQTAHVCKYLQCNPRNFICRVCNKELSRKTFSNHLHETLACQYCNKKFVNPRSMKTHILKQHKGKKLVAPRTYKDRREILQAVKQETEGIDGVKKKVYPKKKLRLECDHCGKYLASRRTLKFHMSLHVGTTSFICENCGEKFYTPTGLKKHSCEKKRRRPERDFRTFDMRYCRFCDTRFENYDENKAHGCVFQHPDDPKKVFCRCCSKEVKKGMFNRHMETHTEIDWVCGVCDKKLITERALKIHLTTHTGNKQYTCTMCPDSFISRAVLDRHMRFHGAAPKLHRCEYCFMELSTETVLRRHIQKIHKMTAVCELCKLELPSKEHLKDHLLTSHEPAVCNICNKSFALPRYLKMHEKLHYDDAATRVACSICSKSLGMKNIKAHVYRHHPDQFDSWLQTYSSP